MDFNSIDELQDAGFTGFQTIRNLWGDHSCIPRDKGVYLVLNPARNDPDFIHPGAGGFFKGKDPNVSVDELTSNFVDGSVVVYVGKAGSPTGKATLYSRLWQYLRFGQGEDVGHRGGRYIWQLQNHADLQFCWKPTPDDDPREIEKQLIASYRDQFGKRPFANLTS